MSTETIWRQAHIRMTDEQWHTIKRAAQEVGLTISAYMRVKALEAAKEDTWG